MSSMRNIIYVVAFLVVVGCGGSVVKEVGDTAAADHDGGIVSMDAGTGSGSGTGVGTLDASATDAPAECNVPPELGQQSCVLCSNEWHCSAGDVVPQCLPGFSGNGSCSGDAQCIACTNDGAGQWWMCIGNEWGMGVSLVPCSR
jgi:hypothetical protein